MTPIEQKRAAARAALSLVVPGTVIGVGSGSTVNEFIGALGASGLAIDACVAASRASEERLRAAGLRVVTLDEALAGLDALPLYVDGADEIDPDFRMIKGGGAALLREKVIATASLRFVCVVDESKERAALGAFPLPVEVVPFARGFVARALALLGGHATERAGVVTDNGNLILDVRGLDLGRGRDLERTIDAIPGVVECGLFELRRADVLLVAGDGGVTERRR